MNDRARRSGTGRHGWRVTVVGALATLLFKLLGHTWRVRFTGRDRFLALRAAGTPVIMAVWHGELIGFIWSCRGRGTVGMVSESKDGEIITRVSHGVGFTHVRGSSSRGGARALLGAVRALQEGHEVALTPDGPRGPAEVFQPGAIAAAQRTGAPIVPFRVRASRAWRFNDSWDRFFLPKPFARVTVAVGEPVFIAADTEESMEALCARLAQAMTASGALEPHAD